MKPKAETAPPRGGRSGSDAPADEAKEGTMTKEELLKRLKEADEASTGDPEMAHYAADRALLWFINDPEITAAFETIMKWYA